MPTLVSDLIEDTKRLLYGAGRLLLNRVPSPGIGISDSTITTEFDLNDITRGSLVSIDDEIMYVMSATAASKQAVVIRGFLGTAAAVHATGAFIEVNPRFPRQYIKEALQREIDSWGSRLYKVTTQPIAFSTMTRIYDLGVTNFINVIGIQLSAYTGRTSRSRAYRWQVLRDEDTSLYASGTAIELLGEFPTSGTMRVKLSQKFDVSTWTDATDVESLGLASSMVDIPPIGAAWRLMSTKEIQRTNLTAQPEPRLAAEVPAGHTASVGAQLKKLRDDRIEEERWTLQERYPARGVA